MLWVPRAESSSVDAIETLGINSFWAWLGFLWSTAFGVLPAAAVRMQSFLMEASRGASGCPTKCRSSLELSTWHSTALHNSPPFTHPFIQLRKLFCVRSSLGDVESSFLHPPKFSSCSWKFKYIKKSLLESFLRFIDQLVTHRDTRCRLAKLQTSVLGIVTALPPPQRYTRASEVTARVLLGRETVQNCSSQITS